MTSQRRQDTTLDPDCIELHALVSTDHVSKATAVILDVGAPDLPMSCYPLEYGWRVPTGAPTEHEPEIPSDLWQVMQVAKRSACAWIRLDCDGPFIDGLDCFDR